MKETTAKKKFMWNMAGSLCNSLSSMLLLIIVNRISGESRGGFLHWRILQRSFCFLSVDLKSDQFSRRI